MADIQTYLNNILKAVYGKDVRQSIHDAIQQCYEDGSAGSIDLTARQQIQSLSNPNLLINSDFRNLINQRGVTSHTYEWGSYGCKMFDRWFGYGGTTVSIEDGYVRVQLDVDNQRQDILLKQTVEIASNQIPNKMTLSFKMRASKLSKFMIYDTNRYLEIGTDWQTYSVTFTKDELGENGLKNGFINILFGIKDYDNPSVAYMNAGDYFDIEWAKLEVGEVATPLIPRLRALELQLCQRYYQKFEKQPVYTTSETGITYRGFILNTPMRANPNLTLLKAYDSSATEVNTVSVVSKVSYDTNIINAQLNKSIGQYGYISYELDAEI